MAVKRSAELSAAEVLAALGSLAARQTQPLRAVEVPEGLRFSVQRHFGTFEAACDAARLPRPDLARRWSREKVLSEIKRLNRQGVRITDLGLVQEHNDLLSAIRGYFSGLPEARRVAKIPEPVPLIVEKPQRWDETRVIAEIEELDRSGESVAASKVPNPLRKAGTRYFGSWSNALEAAGLDPSTVRLVRAAYTDEDLLGVLRSAARTEPEMGMGELAEQSYYLALIRVFGDVETALARAGLREWPIRRRGATISKREVLAAIRRRARDGQPTHRDVVIEEDHLLWHSAMVHFGSWLAAAEAAAVDLSDHNRRWSHAALLEALRSRAREGTSLRASDVRRDDNPLYQSVRAYFGSYAAGCKKAGVGGRLPSRARRALRARADKI